MQVAGHRVHAARHSPRRDMAVWPDQDDVPGEFVTGLWNRRDDLKVVQVGLDRGVAPRAGRVRGGSHQYVVTAAQYAVQRGGLVARADLDIGHALPGSRRAVAAAAVLADQGSWRVGDVDLAHPARGTPGRLGSIHDYLSALAPFDKQVQNFAGITSTSTSAWPSKGCSAVTVTRPGSPGRLRSQTAPDPP